MLFNRQIAMNNAKPALLRQGNRHVRFGHGIHGRADDWDIQPDVACKLGLRAGVRRNHIGARRQQQHVVEGKGFGDRKVNHKKLYRMNG